MWRVYHTVSEGLRLEGRGGGVVIGLRGRARGCDSRVASDPQRKVRRAREWHLALEECFLQRVPSRADPARRGVEVHAS